MNILTKDEAKDVLKILLENNKTSDFMPDGRFVTITDCKEALDQE